MSVKMKMKLENQSHGHKNKVDMDTKIVNLSSVSVLLCNTY